MKVLINFYAAVSEGTVNNLINSITQQISISSKNTDDPLEEVIIQISSSGGSSDHGLLAYNYLKQLSIPKTTIGMGNVDSAAVMIFAAGDKRFAVPNCRFLFHQALSPVGGMYNATKLREFAKLNERITKDYCKVIAKVSEKQLRVVEKEVKEGHVMSSDEAKRYNFVQEIQEQPYLTDLEGVGILMINNPIKKTAAQSSTDNESEN